MPFGGAIKLTGESEYVRALTQINGKLKETTADMKLVSASFSSNDKSVQATAQKTEVLTRKLNEQKEKLSLLKSEYAKMQGTYSEQKSKHEQLVQEYQKEEKELERIAKESGTTSKAYQDQKKKVDALAKDVEKSTKADIANEKAMSKMRAEITKTEAEVKKTTRQIDDLGKETKQTASETKDAGDGFTVFKGILSNLATGAIRAVIDGLKKLAKAAYEAWKEFDEGADIIIAKTGDTGQGIMDVYGRVAGQVPADLEEIGSAVGQVSTRFDLQGEALEDVTTQFLKFAKVNQTDVEGSIDSVQSMMAAWNIRTKDTTRVLSVLTSASQKTGINVDTLSDLMVTNAAAIQELGLGYEDAAFFVGEFSKSGLDTSQTMMGLKKALQAATKEGKPLNQFLAEAEKNIKGAKTEQEALTIATNTFGTKAGPNLAKALRNGNISFKDFEKGVKASDKALDDTFDAMMDLPDRVKMISNQTKTIVGNLVQSLGNGTILAYINEDLPSQLDQIIPHVNTLIAGISSAFTTNYSELKDGLSDALISALGEIDTEPIGEALMAVIVNALGGSGFQSSPELGEAGESIFGGILRGAKNFLSTEEAAEMVSESWKSLIFSLLGPFTADGRTFLKEAIGKIWAEGFPQTIKELPEEAQLAVWHFLESFGVDIGKGLEEQTAQLGNAFFTLLSAQLINLYYELQKWGAQLLREHFMGIINTINDLLGGALDPILQKLGEISNAVLDWITEKLVSFISELTGLGEETVQAFIDGILGRRDNARKSAGDVAKDAEKGLSTGKKGAKKQGSDTSSNYASGVSSGKGKAGSAASGVAGAVTSGLSPAAQTAYNVGVDVSNGIAAGILAGKASILEVATNIANEITQKFKDAQKIKSPSKVMAEEVGLPMAQGIAVGFEDEMKELSGQMAETIPTTFGVSASTRSTSRQAREQANMVTAFKQALSDVKIVLNNKVAGQFVETTVSRLIYS